MANVFDQAPSAPTPGPFAPHADRVWGYAGFWWRVLAWAIDGVMLSVVTGIAHLALGGGSLGVIDYAPSGPVTHIYDISLTDAPGFVSPVHATWHFHGPGFGSILGFLFQVGYFSLLESSRWQATIGKRVCGLRVTGLDGGRISLPRALGRYFGKFLSALILGIGFLMVAWTRRKQALHDILAETLVVRLRPPNDLVRFTPPS